MELAWRIWPIKVSSHIEQAFLKVLGQILQNSCWPIVVVSSRISTGAGAQAILQIINLTKARAIHETTAAVLYSQTFKILNISIVVLWKVL